LLTSRFVIILQLFTRNGEPLYQQTLPAIQRRGKRSPYFPWYRQPAEPLASLPFTDGRSRIPYFVPHNSGIPGFVPTNTHGSHTIGVPGHFPNYSFNIPEFVPQPNRHYQPHTNGLPVYNNFYPNRATTTTEGTTIPALTTTLKPAIPTTELITTKFHDSTDFAVSQIFTGTESVSIVTFPYGRTVTVNPYAETIPPLVRSGF